MIRKFLAHWLGADLEPAISWSEIDSLEKIAMLSVGAPRLWGRADLVEQVLCQSDQSFVLLSRWLSSGRMTRVSFGKALDGSQMRLMEKDPGPKPVFRLMLSPIAGQPVVFTMSSRTWFGLWKNETHADLSSGPCFLDGTDREVLKGLRSRLLKGKVPESLLVEEEMWERMNGLSDADRRVAMAQLATQAMAEVDRKFHELYPNAGPPPDELAPLLDRVQKQKQEIEQTASSRPVDPEVAKLMQRFMTNSLRKNSGSDSP